MSGVSSAFLLLSGVACFGVPVLVLLIEYPKPVKFLGGTPKNAPEKHAHNNVHPMSGLGVMEV